MILGIIHRILLSMEIRRCGEKTSTESKGYRMHKKDMDLLGIEPSEVMRGG